MEYLEPKTLINYVLGLKSYRIVHSCVITKHNRYYACYINHITDFFIPRTSGESFEELLEKLKKIFKEPLKYFKDPLWGFLARKVLKDPSLEIYVLLTFNPDYTGRYQRIKRAFYSFSKNSIKSIKIPKISRKRIKYKDLKNYQRNL